MAVSYVRHQERITVAQSTSGVMFSEDYWNRAAEIDAALQSEAAVLRATLPNGVTAWIITRYEEARGALSDPRLSKDINLLTSVLTEQLAATGRSILLSSMFSPHMLFSDPPAHGRLRELVQGQFNRDRVQALRPRIEQTTTRLLAGLSRTATVDLIAEFAFPLSVAIIGDLLGVAAHERAALSQWITATMRDDEFSVPASRELSAYLAGLVAQRRAEPGEDLLSELSTVVVDGDRLSDQEVVGTAVLIVVGHENMTNLVGNAARWLLEQPDRWRGVGMDPSGLPEVIEELLRFDSPGRLATHRCTIAPVVYGGVTIPAGEIVLVSVAAANRDPRCFAHPDQIDWHREASETRQHLALGHGIHHCLGAGMTRMEAEIGLAGLARSFPDARLAVPAGQLRRQHSAGMNGFQTLPVLLGPP
jgi:cytochrome P450